MEDEVVADELAGGGGRNLDGQCGSFAVDHRKASVERRDRPAARGGALGAIAVALVRLLVLLFFRSVLGVLRRAALMFIKRCGRRRLVTGGARAGAGLRAHDRRNEHRHRKQRGEHGAEVEAGRAVHAIPVYSPNYTKFNEVQEIAAPIAAFPRFLGRSPPLRPSHLHARLPHDPIVR